MIKIIKEDYNDAYTRLKDVVESYNYIFGDAFIERYPSGKLMITISISPDKNKNPYLPEIFTRDHDLTHPIFAIQTTSYGALEEVEYNEFRKAVQNAYSLLDYLQNPSVYKDLEILDVK